MGSYSQGGYPFVCKYMKIELRNGEYFEVDRKDYKKVSMKKWTTNKSGYVIRYFRDKETKRMGCISLSRFLMGVLDKTWREIMVDHINGDKLNNKRSNLRLASNTENQWNSKKSIRNTSGYKGVNWHKRHKRWMVCIQAECVGYYDDLEVAAWHYNKFAKERFGNFARLNIFENEDSVKKKVDDELKNPPKSRGNTSGFDHVSYCKREKKYRAYCSIDGKYKSLGYYESAEKAHNAYKQFSCSMQAQTS